MAENQIKKELLLYVDYSDPEKPKILEHRILVSGGEMKWMVVQNPPELTTQTGKNAEYELSASGQVSVKYTDREKTAVEKLMEEIETIKKSQTNTMLAVVELENSIESLRPDAETDAEGGVGNE